MQQDGRCVPCSATLALWASFLGGAAVLCGVVGATIAGALRGDHRDDFSTVMSSVAVIGMNYAQGTALLAGFNLDWGSSVRAFFTALKVASGTVTGSVSFGCVVSIDYATRAYVSLVGGPLLVALGPALALYPFSTACCWRMLPRKRLARTWATSSLVLAWLLYAAITQEAYRVVHCVAIADAEGNVRRWMRDELTVRCDTPTHGRVLALALVVLVGFGALLPLALLARMYR